MMDEHQPNKPSGIQRHLLWIALLWLLNLIVVPLLVWPGTTVIKVDLGSRLIASYLAIHLVLSWLLSVAMRTDKNPGVFFRFMGLFVLGLTVALGLAFVGCMSGLGKTNSIQL